MMPTIQTQVSSLSLILATLKMKKLRQSISQVVKLWVFVQNALAQSMKMACVTFARKIQGRAKRVISKQARWFCNKKLRLSRCKSY